MFIPRDVVLELEKAGYRFVGRHRHAAVKVCHWTRKSLLNRGSCYKQKFYGIQSHRCLQLAPGLPLCDHRCIFCWRNIEITNPRWEGETDDPAEILEEAIAAQRLLLSGFGGNPEVDKKKFREALAPNHCAISLAGEPTLYPKINGLIEECRRRGMTSFLVSNGQHPEVLERLVEPTQLYISLVAPDPESYQRICRPVRSDGWERLRRSLEILASFSCRKVIRLTLVKGLNFRDPQAYARMVEDTEADFIEVKAYMCVGYSRSRLGLENMPLHSEIVDFARAVAEATGYRVSDEAELSRVVLLSRR
ncbi:MAG: 4-demethylwyosine synthase TYW1 [Candidatus Hadarchaeum sp.]|uniref:4-demethylwyosine synthase TYW1 n=1 Tax=Candidatus Hadarchaeum sp. TaxID=2883567 RepID=UPI003D0F2CDD